MKSVFICLRPIKGFARSTCREGLVSNSYLFSLRSSTWDWSEWRGATAVQRDYVLRVFAFKPILFGEEERKTITSCFLVRCPQPRVILYARVRAVLRRTMTAAAPSSPVLQLFLRVFISPARFQWRSHVIHESPCTLNYIHPDDVLPCLPSCYHPLRLQVYRNDRTTWWWPTRTARLRGRDNRSRNLLTGSPDI